MENLLITGFVFLCVLFAFVLTLHIAAERELQNKARRLEDLESRSADGWVAGSHDHDQQTRLHGMERQIAELKEENAQLHAEIVRLREEKQGLGISSERKEKAQEQLAKTERDGEPAPTDIVERDGTGTFRSEEPLLFALTTEVPAVTPEPAGQQALGEENTPARRSYVLLTGAVFVLVSAAIVTAGLWRNGSTVEVAIPVAEKSPVANSITQTSGAGKTAAEPQEPLPAKKPEALTAKIADTAAKKSTVAAAPKRRATSSGRQDGAKISQPAGRPYEVVSATPVYSKPDEESQTVASAIRGMTVNVVRVRGDWLEIRSKHGRPPGFIKKESAEPAS
jgi:hypothetical protein